MNQPTSRHDSGKGFGSLVLVLLIVVIALLVKTWPWWLIIPLVLAVIALVKRRKLVWISLTVREVEPAAGRFRLWVMGGLLVLGWAAILCVFALNLEGLQWFLIPILLFAGAIHLLGLSIRPSRWESLQRSLCDNFVELLVISAIVLACYWVAVLRLQALPLNDTTVDQLRKWEEKVMCAHEYFETHAPSFRFLAALFVFTLVLRIYAKVRPALSERSRTISTVFATGLKWLGRASTVAALAATLTFLAVQDNGPGGKIGLALKNAKEDYKHFQEVLTGVTDKTLRQALINKAWNERPTILKQEMTRLAQFEQERNAYEAMRQTAIDKFHVSDVPASLSFTMPDSNHPDLPTSSDEFRSPWTPEALHEAALNVVYLDPPVTHDTSLNDLQRKIELFKSLGFKDIPNSKDSEALPDHNDFWPMQANVAKSTRVFTGTSAVAPAEGENESDASDEIAKEALDALEPGDLILRQSPRLAVLDSHYPGFGEIIEAITSSVTDVVFDGVRNWVVKEVTKRWSIDGHVSVSQIQELVKDKISAIHFDFRSFTPAWAAATAARISGYREQVGLARTRLLKAALDKERDETEKSARATREDAKVLDAAGTAIRSDDLGKTAESVGNFTGELAALGASWPPLTEPDKAQLAELSAISERIRRSNLAKSESSSSKGTKDTDASAVLIIAAQSPIAAALHLNPDWQSPLEGISALHRFCRANTLLVVATSLSSATQSAALQKTMGSEYFSAITTWKSEVSRQLAVQAAIDEREKAAMQAAIVEENLHPYIDPEKPHDYDVKPAEPHPIEGIP